MSLAPRLIGRAVLGAVFGVAIIVIACVAAGGVAWTTEGSVSVPLVIDIRVAQENGLPAVFFEPQFAGMLVIIVAFAALSVAGGLLRGRSVVARGA